MYQTWWILVLINKDFFSFSVIQITPLIMYIWTFFLLHLQIMYIHCLRWIKLPPRFAISILTPTLVFRPRVVSHWKSSYNLINLSWDSSLVLGFISWLTLHRKVGHLPSRLWENQLIWNKWRPSWWSWH